MNGSMVSMADYAGMNGFGVASMNDVAELNKALNTGAYAQANGITGQVNGAALQVESLEASLKVLTYDDKHVKLWKKISKTPAYSTVEEYNVLQSYGSNVGGFVAEGQLPIEDDSHYQRKASFVKFLGTTRSVTHPMTLVRSAHGDVIAQENANGIRWLMKQAEHALFWGDSSLAAPGTEGVQFDGLNKMIDPLNTVDMKGADLTAEAVNYAAEMILENYATPTDLFLPYEVLATFSNSYFPKERVIMPTQAGGYSAGLVVNKFQTNGGEVEFQPDLFLQRTTPINSAVIGGANAPTAPASLTAALGTGTDAEFAKEGAVGTYSYSVTACNRYGESTPVALSSVGGSSATSITLTSGDEVKGIVLTITNAASVVVAPEWYTIYRTEKNGTEKYAIARVPAASVASSGTTTWTDKDTVMPNTFTAFIGEMSPQVLTFKQLAPIMKMDLALIGPAYRWMILLYGVPQLFAPRKWARITNIKCNTPASASGLYYGR